MKRKIKTLPLNSTLHPQGYRQLLLRCSTSCILAVVSFVKAKDKTLSLNSTLFEMRTNQKIISLKARDRGFHLITDEVVQALPELADYSVGVLHLFIQHTSASLTINENADPTVRSDFSSHFDRFVPENAPYYRHTLEGSDDMPAHIKASLLGSSISVPVTQGCLALGSWQGIYLGEHRDFGGERRLIATLMGEGK